ncbi:MAG: glycosyltransferase family 39 protein [Candidatus Hydrogenedentes bacterium]|nr:glycosyltransferase family 39 protein [Candidatus Hydrogenedentota bacterium]
MWKWIGFAAVLAITLATRLYGAANESVWYDEAASVSVLDESSLTDFLAAGRQIDALKVPLYFFIEYAWWHTVGASVFSLRLLSILISLITTAVLYWGAMRLWGNWTAVIASLCFALSKHFIFYGQEIRMYALMYLLALVSWFLLHAALQHKRWAWILHAIANLLLMQTHLLGLCNLAAQFVFLVLLDWRAVRRIVTWCAAHAIIALTVLPWLLQYKSFDRGLGWIPMPGIGTLANTFLLVYTGSTYADDYPLPIVPMWFSAVIAVPAAVLGLRALLRDKEKKATALMLLCWMVTPPALMFLASHILVPSYVDRYALYAAFPAFIFIGCGFAAMPRPARYTFCPLLIALYTFGVSQIQRPMRPDIRSAADYIRFDREPTDHLIARGMGYELCLDVYFPNIEKAGLLQRIPTKRAIREVQRGQRTWVVIDPLHEDFARWWQPIEEAIADRTIVLEHDRVAPGPRPVRVFLLKPT